MARAFKLLVIIAGVVMFIAGSVSSIETEENSVTNNIAIEDNSTASNIGKNDEKTQTSAENEIVLDAPEHQTANSSDEVPRLPNITERDTEDITEKNTISVVANRAATSFTVVVNATASECPAEHRHDESLVVILLDRRDCASFVMCAPGLHGGEPRTMSCPPGRFFSPLTKSCSSTNSSSCLV